MAPTSASTRRTARAVPIASPASNALETTPRSTRRSAAIGLNGVQNDGGLDEELVAAETPSRRARRTGGSTASTTTPLANNGAKTTPSSRKRKAEEMLGQVNGGSPEPEEQIVVEDAATRSSGRARKKTTKLTEMEAPQIATKATKVTKTTPKSMPKGRSKGGSKASLRKSTKRDQQAEPEPEPEPEPEAVVQEAPIMVEPKDLAVSAAAIEEQQDGASTPATTPRKRGRPKGSKNKKTLEKALADPPFADISITPNSKARKLAQEAKAAQEAADAMIEAEARALEEKAKLLEQSADPINAEAITAPTEPQTTSDEPQPAFDALIELLKKPAYAKTYATLREEIILRLSGRKLTPLVGVEQEYDQVRSLIQQTVAAGEGNSMLVIGNRGSGKTTLVETALREVSVEHAQEYHVIRLNGFVHTDDKVALKEIWRQLGEEMELGDDEHTTRSNYADTLASLLAVLSHLADSTGDGERQYASKSVVFILDEFDLFTTHPRQTLLYNLFDIAQSRKAPIAVIGLTTKIDVLEALEKRVKSRFSHRYVHLPAARTYATFLAVVKSALHCDAQPEFRPPSDAPDLSPLKSSDTTHKTLVGAWTTHIDAALFTEPLASQLRRIYAHSKSVPQVFTGILPAVITSTARSPPRVTSLAHSLPRLSPPDSKISILSSLSDAQLAVLIAAARLDVVLATDAVNFLLAHDEYTKLALRAKVVSNPLSTITLRTWGRDVLLAAWEGLAAKGLLIPVLGGDLTGRAAAVAADAGKRGRLWRVDVSLEEIARFLALALGNAAGGGAGVAVYREVERWCRNI